MGEDFHFGVGPHRIVQGQRFCGKDVKDGEVQPARIQRFDEIRFHQMTAPCEVDKRCSLRQSTQEVLIQDPFGAGGERKQTNQNIAAGQHCLEPFRSAERLDALNLLGTSGPPKRGEPVIR